MQGCIKEPRTTSLLLCPAVVLVEALPVKFPVCITRHNSLSESHQRSPPLHKNIINRLNQLRSGCNATSGAM